MTKLLEALTGLAIQATQYLRSLEVGSDEGGVEENVEEPKPKAKRGRKKKVEKTVEDESPAAAPAEEQGATERSVAECLTITKQFVERCKNDSPAGIDVAKQMLIEFEVAKIKELTPEARVAWYNAISSKLQAKG